MSISAHLREAISHHATAQRVAIAGANPVSYAELGKLFDAFAAGVADWGVKRGDRVGILAPKSVASIAAFFGTMQAGGCACLVEPTLAPEVVAEQAATVGMRHLVVDPTYAESFGAARLPGLTVRSLSTLKSDEAFFDATVGPDDEAMLLFTSGSTGRPKGVLLRHGNLLCNADGVLAQTGTTPQDKLLHVMPIYHTNGINNQLIVPFLAGASLILHERFKPDAVMRALRVEAPTYMTGVPTIFARLLPLIEPGETFPTLRFLRCGSAPITAEQHRQIEDAFGVPLIVSYGLSEATCTSTMNPPVGRKLGTIGQVLRGQSVKLFDPATDTEAPAGGEGEIRISGPALMAGYLGSAEQPVVDGWLRTGDLGRFDDDGFLSITGRIKDIIIRGGENISPVQVERCLNTHPAVRECCVVGTPHADLGEVPIAFIVPQTGAVVDEAALKSFVAATLSRSCVPAEIRRLDVLPTNSVGKVDRKVLRQVAASPAEVFVLAG